MNPNNPSYDQNQTVNTPSGYSPAQPYPQSQPQYGQPNIPGQTPLAPNIPGQPQASQPEKQTNPNSTQNTLQIAEIRDGIVIMNDGSFRSVVMVRSINFDLMNPQEQEAVEYSYQNFLNSLYFPIQILVRSKKVDIRPYLEKLDKIRSEHDNMLLSLLMEDYIDFMNNISMQTNIMDKQFYVIIPFEPAGLEAQKAVEASKNFMNNLFGSFRQSDPVHIVINEPQLEEAKTELRNRVQAILSGLMQTGVQGLPLDTQELIELYYDSYNPDTATRQQLRSFDNLTAPVITKGEGVAPQPGLDREMY